jgi:gamma-glutamyl-gamma-aminobutyrate hydrolase PuuD
MLISKLRIGVTMRTLQAEGYDEPRDALASVWASFLITAFPEAMWMPLPNIGRGSIKAYCEQWGINRLILSGGEDFGVSPMRDETEHQLLMWAAEHKIPVLGVCRGMQMMAAYKGIGLKLVDGHVRKRHTLQGSLTHEVNSYHRYSLAECPQDFVVTAQAEDGEIEAIKHSTLEWEGWMWHPERERPFNLIDIDRLKALFK